MLRGIFCALPVIVGILVLPACSSDDDQGGGARLREGTDGGATDSGASSTDGSTDAGTDAPASDGAPGDSGPQGPVESGEATYYDAEGVGSCGVEFPTDYLVAAMNDEQYKKAYCGKCVSVTGPKGSVVVRILDLCPGCKSGDLDLSVTAFTKIADKAAGRVPISWYFVDCPF